MPRSASAASDSTVTAYVKSTRPSSANRNNRYYQSQSQQPLVQVNMNDGAETLEKKQNQDQTRNHDSSMVSMARANVSNGGKFKTVNGDGTNGVVQNGMQPVKKSDSAFVEMTGGAGGGGTPTTVLQNNRSHNYRSSYMYGVETYGDVKNGGKPTIIFQQPQPTTASWSRYGSELMPESCVSFCLVLNILNVLLFNSSKIQFFNTLKFNFQLYTCRHCDNEIVTATSSQRGLCVWLSACALCFFGCCCFCWVPFV